MSTTDLYADLIRRAEACEKLSETWDENHAEDLGRVRGKAAAYRHAAELLRGAVAAAVEEEREGCAEMAERVGRAWGTASHAASAIRARGESPRGDAASDGREGAE